MSQRDLIVNALLEEPKKTISGEDLAKRLSISRTSVWKNIKALQKEGYEIKVLKARGYRLKNLTKRPLEREVKRGLYTKRFGNRVFYYEEIDSTNNAAKELARKGVENGALVIAGRQSKGRGRLERRWKSPEGGLYASIVLRPDIHPSRLTAVALLFGLAIVKAIKSLHNLDVKLKWPNDVLYKDKKLAGVLTEMEGEADKVNFIVVGMGINANTDVSVDIPATSLKRETGAEVNLVALLQETLWQAEGLYEGFIKDPTAFLDEYKEHCQTLGRDVKIVQPSRILVGRGVDIDKDGALVLCLPDGSYEKVLSGDCIHLR